MSDHDYSAGESESLEHSGILGAASRAASTWVGAALSLTLMAGMSIWFYRLGTRDATQIPVIRASLEPVKERPADPGGDQAPHQGMKSYSLLEGGAVPGTAPEPRPQLAPEPPAPEPGDGPLVSAAPSARPAVAPAAETVPDTAVAAAPLREPEPAPEAEPETPSLDGAELAALTDPAAEPSSAAPVASAVPVPEPAPEPETAALAEPEEEPAPVPVSTGPAPATSPMVRPRPAGLVARASAAAAAAPAAEAGAAEALERKAAQSAIQVQLGAFESPDITRQMWSRIFAAHEDLLTGRALAVQSTVSGGKTWYRLRVGPFGSSAEARNICAALQARGQDCIVARNG